MGARKVRAPVRRQMHGMRMTKKRDHRGKGFGRSMKNDEEKSRRIIRKSTNHGRKE